MFIDVLIMSDDNEAPILCTGMLQWRYAMINSFDGGSRRLPSGEIVGV